MRSSIAVDGFIGRDPIYFGIDPQSRTAFPPTNGIRDDEVMDTLRSNLRHLMAERHESENIVGMRSGAGQTWLHRFLKAGIQKPNSAKVELLAKYFGVSPAELQHEDLTVRPGSDVSHVTGLEPQIVAAAVKLVQYIQDVAVEPLPQEQYAHLLYVAMLVVREEGAGGVLDGTSLVDASKWFPRLVDNDRSSASGVSYPFRDC